MDLEIIIGFETHVELKTRTKLFCNCEVAYDALPNAHVCPVCTGQPGALPVLNKRAVEETIRTGIAMNCRINGKARFARKNYFYPDLPKGYQISQYENPFCEEGYLEIPGEDGRPYAVGIKRIHLEEDAGKLVHSSVSFEKSEYSLVDYNRSSLPLMEIVTDHERNPMRSISEARAYLERLRQLLRYIGISDCIIEKGQFRCDVNISLRPTGSANFGNRAEIKNMGSFRFIMNALEYEVKRQTDILKSGSVPLQETRLFDEQKRITLPMRSKEDAPDYRYFPDPDLLEIEIDDKFIHDVKSSLPELPDQKVDRLSRTYGIPRNDLLILTRDREVSDFFEKSARACSDVKRLGHWMVKDLFKLLNDAGLSIDQCPIGPEDFSSLINLIDRGEITDQIARVIIGEMFTRGGRPETILDEKGLRPIQDEDLLNKVLDEVISSHPEAVEKIREGIMKPMDFLVGQVMRKIKGKADAKKVKEWITEKLTAR